MQREALEHVRLMLEYGNGARAAAKLAGFTSRNTDPIIRERGGGRTYAGVYAAVANLYAEAASRAELEDRLGRLGYSKSQVKNWIAGARDRNYLSRPGRKLTPLGRAVLEQDGRDAEAIIDAWRCRESVAGSNGA